MKPVVVLAIVSLALSSCASRRTVSGSWKCETGQGTCAPVSSIDEGALAKTGMSSSASPMSKSLAAPVARQPLLTPFTGDAPPARSNERTLRIVFPSHIDAQGIFHEPAAVHAVVESPAWIPSSRASAPAPPALSGSAERQAMLQSPRLATPEEAQRLAATARIPRSTVGARPSDPALDPGATPPAAAEGFPPFPAPAAGAVSAAPAPASPAGAGAPLPPTASPPVANISLGPASVVGTPRLSPGDPPDAGARLLNRSAYQRLPASGTSPVGQAPPSQVPATPEAQAALARLREGLAPTLSTAPGSAGASPPAASPQDEEP
jgi:conjugal transfer pilus assembly protein TraV